MRQKNCVPHITCLFIACVRSMRTLMGYTHYIHQLNYRMAVGHILKVKYLTDVLSSLRKYILCLAFLLTVSKWKVPGDGETRRSPWKTRVLLVVVAPSDCIYSHMFCCDRVLMCFFLLEALTSCLELLLHYLVNSAGHQ